MDRKEFGRWVEATSVSTYRGACADTRSTSRSIWRNGVGGIYYAWNLHLSLCIAEDALPLEVPPVPFGGTERNASAKFLPRCHVMRAK